MNRPKRELGFSFVFCRGERGSWRIKFSFGQFEKILRHLDRAIQLAVKAGTETVRSH